MNIHLIRHLAFAVRDCGPLWAQSAYGFESNNGRIVHGNSSKRDIVHNITWKYIQYQQTQSFDDPHMKFNIGKLFPMQFTEKEKEPYAKEGVKIDGKISILTKLTLHGVTYKSLRCKETATTDFFIQMKDKTLGAVLHFSNVNSDLYVCIERYEIVNTIDHFIEVNKSSSTKVFHVHEIETKMIHMKFGLRQFLVKRPNKFEKT